MKLQATNEERVGGHKKSHDKTAGVMTGELKYLMMIKDNIFPASIPSMEIRHNLIILI